MNIWQAIAPNKLPWQKGSTPSELGPAVSGALGMNKDSFLSKMISPWNMINGQYDDKPKGFGSYDSANPYFQQLGQMRAGQ